MNQNGPIAFRIINPIIRILLANGRPNDKQAIGLSNQEYPVARDKAMKQILYKQIQIQAAMEIIFNPPVTFNQNLIRETYARKIEKLVMEINEFFKSKETQRRNQVSDKTWKKDERKVAAFFGGQRNPLSGANSRHTGGDVIHPSLYIENKRRQKHSVVSLWSLTAEKAKLEGKIPIVTLTEHGKSGFWVVCKAEDLVKIKEVLNAGD